MKYRYINEPDKIVEIVDNDGSYVLLSDNNRILIKELGQILSLVRNDETMKSYSALIGNPVFSTSGLPADIDTEIIQDIQNEYETIKQPTRTEIKKEQLVPSVPKSAPVELISLEKNNPLESILSKSKLNNYNGTIEIEYISPDLNFLQVLKNNVSEYSDSEIINYIVQLNKEKILESFKKYIQQELDK